MSGWPGDTQAALAASSSAGQGWREGRGRNQAGEGGASLEGGGFLHWILAPAGPQAASHRTVLFTTSKIAGGLLRSPIAGGGAFLVGRG